MEDTSGLDANLMDLLESTLDSESSFPTAAAGAGVTQHSNAAPPPGKQLTPADVKSWICIYPCYLDPNVTVAKGRRLPRSQLVGCDEPWPQDVAYALGSLGAKFPNILLEGNKRHPSWTMFKNFQSPPGRVRVLIKKPDGTPVDDRFPTKQKLLEAIAKAMPNHPARLQRIAQVNAMKQEHEAKIAAAIKSGATGAPKKKDEKKGKKK